MAEEQIHTKISLHVGANPLDRVVAANHCVQLIKSLSSNLDLFEFARSKEETQELVNMMRETLAKLERSILERYHS